MLTLSFIIIVMVIYLAILIHQIGNDTPVLVESQQEIHALYAPDVVIASASPFVIECYYESGVSIFSQGGDTTDCANLTTQPEFFEPAADQLFGLYIATFHGLHIKYTVIGDGIQLLGFTVNFTDNATDNHLEVLAFDREYNPHRGEEYNIFIETRVDNNESIFLSSLIELNRYTLYSGQYASIAFSRMIKEAIKPSFLNYLGFPPQYIKEPYIETSMIITPIRDFVVMEFFGDNYVVTIEHERRTYTVLTSLALLGGAWGLLGSLYSIMFGSDAIQPWGFIQTCCCYISRKTKDNLRNTLKPLPLLSDHSRIEEESDAHVQVEGEVVESTIRSEMVAMRDEIEAMKKFFRDYVVDVDYLEKINITAEHSESEEIDVDLTEPTNEI